MLLCGILAVFPFHLFLKIFLIGVNEEEVVQKSYLEALFDFGIDYERANPITRKQGFESYINLLYKKDYITADEHKKLIETLNSQNTVNLLEVYYSSSLNPSKSSAQRGYIKNLILVAILKKRRFGISKV
jgi:hypothetical protein